MSDDVLRFISDLADLISTVSYCGFKSGNIELEEIRKFDEYKVVAEYFALATEETE